MIRRSMIPRRRGEKRNELASYKDHPFWQMRERMNRYLDNYWDQPFDMDFYEGDDIFSPRIDLSETEEEYTIIADLPGLNQKDIELSFSQNVLTISGKKEEEKEEKGRQYHRIERFSGQFRREIPLQDTVDDNKIEATFKDGVLTINIPKRPDPTQKKKKISIVTK
ncbi:MAG: Hsp20/alpha crystallin family protein [Anaerolineaceae bacterium]|nr:Hsp20/alpha crystallin family protein [Anaerolineaceae bacterium]